MITLVRRIGSIVLRRLSRHCRIAAVLLSVELLCVHRLPAQRSPAMPDQVIRTSLGPARDSAHAVRIAQRVLNAAPTRSPLKTAFFASVDGGYLIKLVPEPATPGGGGLVWVESDGRVRVLRRYRRALNPRAGQPSAVETQEDIPKLQ